MTLLLDSLVEKTINTLFKKGSNDVDEIEFWNEHWKKRIKYMEEHGIPWQFDGAWQRNVYERKIALFGQLAGDVAGKKILEPGAGCGIVSLVQSSRGAEVHLVEMSDAALQYLGMIRDYLGIKERAHIVKANMFKLPYDNNTFNITWNSGVVEHYDIASQAIKEMIRVTKHEGQIIVAVPNLLSPELLYNAMKNGRGTEHYFSKNGLAKFLRSFGLVNVQTYSLTSVLPSTTPAKVLNTLKEYENYFGFLGFLYFGAGIVRKEIAK